MDKKQLKSANTIKKIFFIAGLALSTMIALWYAFIALKEQSIPQSEIIASYSYRTPDSVEMTFKDIGNRQMTFSYRSFDGSLVNGQISYPAVEREKYPVLIGVSAMGRGYQRWWTDSFNGQPTVTRVNEIGKIATEKDYVVIAIDARYHGTRKDPHRSLRSIMNDLHFFGDRSYYERMILETVLDYRILIDWIEGQQNLDRNRLVLAGYSMGAQIGLLIGALDHRVEKIIAMVPPHISDKTALVAPKNLASLIKAPSVLLITANGDEHASEMDNRELFRAIASKNKENLTFEGGHILPQNYVDALAGWL